MELRQELEKEGILFYTNSDTEVFLAAYRQWGVGCFNRFNGMWATCILDEKRKKVVISRDRFGIKPLFYYRSGSGICFFSEIKQILKSTLYEKKINENVVRDFLESAVLDASYESFFKGVYKFPQSHFVEIYLDDKDFEFVPKRYWDLSFDNTAKVDFKTAAAKFRTLFQQSIELRFRSDVPVGACLSGGLDSSSIVSFAGFLGKKVQAFTVDNYQKSLSEIDYVNDVVGKYDSLTSVVTYNQESDLDLIDKMLTIQDEPISGLGVIAQWRVMKLTSDHYIKVLLDGQGGDELLGGYRKFIFFYLKELINKGKIPLALKEASNFLSSPELKLFEKEGVRRYLKTTNVSSVLSKSLSKRPSQFNIGLNGAKDFRQKAYDDIMYFSYPQLLRYEDRNSMAFSIESRVPFLDYRLVEFVFSLPSSFLIKEGYTKAILREGMKGIIPESVRIRKSKLGFATPEQIWVEQKYKYYFFEYFRQLKNPFLDTSKIATVMERPRNKSLDYKSLLRLYLFDRWYQIHFR